MKYSMQLQLCLLAVSLIKVEVKGDYHSPSNKEEEESDKIVGGEQTDIRSFPYQVALIQVNNDRLFCGGSIISEKWVLTAKHCIPSHVRPKQIKIRVGSSDYSEGGDVYYIDRIIYHPRSHYERFDYDVVLLEVSTKMEFGSGVSAVDLPPLEEDLDLPSVNTRMVVSGWGTQREGGRTSRMLRAVTVKVINVNTCRRAYPRLWTSRMICAADYEKDHCHGDSGGPLVKDNVLYGVVSYATGCALSRFPGVYASTSNYEIREFIQEYTDV